MKITLCVLALTMTSCHAPVPKPVIIHDDRGMHVHLECPEGWHGDATWHTIQGLNKDQQLQQYLKDASESGVCVLDGSPSSAYDPYPARDSI